MTRTQSLVVVMVLLMNCGALLLAQKPSDTMPPGKNPHLGNKASIQSGLALYRVRCGGPWRDAGRTAFPDDSQRRAGHRDAAERHTGR